MLVRTAVIVLASAYAVFLGVLAYAWRHPVERVRAPSLRAPPRRGLVWHALRTAGAGYAAFLAIVLVFHVIIAGQRGAFSSAVWGGAFLAAVAIPVFLLASWLFDRPGKS